MYIPTKPDKYYCQPFWKGKNQKRQLIKCYFKDCLIDEEIGLHTELVCDYGGHSHLVALTGINNWEPRKVNN